MDTTTITFKEGGWAEFQNALPEFFSDAGMDFVGIGVGEMQIAVYARKELTRVVVDLLDD